MIDRTMKTRLASLAAGFFILLVVLEGGGAAGAASPAPQRLVLKSTGIDTQSELSVELWRGGEAELRSCDALDRFGACKAGGTVRERRLSAREVRVLSDLASKANLFSGRSDGIEFDFSFRSLEVHARGQVTILVTTANPSFTEPGPRKDLLSRLFDLESLLSPK